MGKISKILICIFLFSFIPYRAMATEYAPDAAVSVSPSSGSLETIFVFDASESVDSRGFHNTLEYRWNFNTGASDWTDWSSDSIVTHQYSEAGTISIKVEVRDADGYTDYAWTEVKVDEDIPYEAEFTVNPEKGDLDTEFAFDIDVTTNITIPLSEFEYRWDFDGDGEYDTTSSTSENMSHYYGTSGTYTPILEITAPDGTAMTIRGYETEDASSGGSITVSSSYDDPNASLNYYPSSGNEDTRFYFSAEDSFDTDDYFDLEYRWDYEGDGLWDTDWSSESDTDWKYSVAGAYEPTVQVRDSDGNLDQTSINITIGSEGFAPEAKFTVSVDSRLADKDVGTTDTEFTFNATTSKDEETSASALQVRWDYEGDGEWDTTFSDDTKYAYHTYTEAAEYIPTLEVMDSDGNVATYDYEIRVVENTPPNATFDVDPTEATPGVEFTFDAGSCSDDQYKSAYLEVRWDYEGDGTWDTNFSTTKSSRHYYDDSGTYDVVVQVKDPEGQTAEASEEITVLSNTVPVAAFTVSPDNGTYSTAFAFDASSSYDGQTDSASLWYRWDFDYNGDSDITYDTSWTHTKTTSHYFDTDEGTGEISVRLEVKDEDDEVATAVQTVSIHWASPYLEELKDAGIMRGYSGDMKPDQNITRAELLKIVLEGVDTNMNSMTYKGYFTDVKSSDWHWKYVEKAYELGIISGYTDGTFLPNQNINRAEAVKIIIGGFGVFTDDNYEKVFDDVSSEDWFFPYVMAAYDNSFVSGYEDGTFGPSNNMTRGEAAKVVWTAME